MSIYVIEEGDEAGLIVALLACGILEGGPPGQRGGVIVTRVMHESWCAMPDGGKCTCRDDYRDGADVARARAKSAIARAKAKAKAARQARRKSRGRK